MIDEGAVTTFEEASNEAKKNGRLVIGGERLTEGELAKGTFVQPTIAEVPLDSWIWKKELFVPFVAVAPYDDLDEAIRLANDTEYGLTAGFYSEDRAEIDRWLELDRGWRRVREPAGGSDHGRVARRAAVRRLEGLGHQRQGRWRPVLRAAVPAEQSRTVIEE